MIAVKRVRTVLLACLLALALPALAGGEEPPSRQELPDPVLFLEPDSCAIAVIRARAEDVGFRQMLSTALSGANGSGGGTLGGFVTSFLSFRKQEEMLLAALPFQMVRSDRVGTDGQLDSTVSITLAGWRGLQGLIYQSMLAGKEGKPYETREHRGEEIILREGWQDRRLRMVFSRVKGTFLNCATPDQARYMIDRVLDPKPAPVDSELSRAYAELDQSKDSFGAVVNVNGSLLRVMDWVNRYEMVRVRKAVGVERLEQNAALIRRALWDADVASDDEVDIHVTFDTASVEDAHKVGEVLEEVRGVLEEDTRMGDFYMTYLPDGKLTVGFAMVGFRPHVRGFLGTVRL